MSDGARRIVDAAKVLYDTSQREWNSKGKPDWGSTRGDVRAWYLALAQGLADAGLLATPKRNPPQ